MRLSFSTLVAFAASVLMLGAVSPALARHRIAITSQKAGDTLAVFYSGDGGWGGLDQSVARHLADNGVPTLGVNSLAYFAAKRSPDAVAQDLAASLREYGQRWKRQKVVLIGYSFGAAALPAILPRLPADVRARVSAMVLIGTVPYGDLRFHLASWFDRPAADSYLVRPAIEALPGLSITCIYGDRERNDICPSLNDGQVRKVRLRGGHHFDGDYAALGAMVLRAAQRSTGQDEG